MVILYLFILPGIDFIIIQIMWLERLYYVVENKKDVGTSND